MSTVDKMLIKGIRSFDPENKNVITFFKPLTLIVGPNGAGKTTIIECLKLSCTGELPPNARSGHSFIHDPKVAGETETKGQIKLRFKTAAGRDVVCIRSFQLTQKASKMEYKAIESVLQTINPHSGEKVCLSYRCADMDREIPALMGVSKAILENVIFVHQDEANWPLQDPSTLKKKFDDIFSATRYTKALEVIKKLHKDQAQEIKTYKLKLENLQTLKDAAYTLRESIAQDQEKTESQKDQIQQLDGSIKDLDTKINHGEKTLKHLLELQKQISAKTTERSTLLEGQERQHADLAEEYEETDEELMEMKTKFDERIAISSSQIRKLEREKNDISIKRPALRNAINESIGEISKLQTEEEAHKSLKNEQDTCIQNIFSSYNLGSLPKPPFSAADGLNLTNRIKSRLRDLEKDLEHKKSSRLGSMTFESNPPPSPTPTLVVHSIPVRVNGDSSSCLPDSSSKRTHLTIVPSKDNPSTGGTIPSYGGASSDRGGRFGNLQYQDPSLYPSVVGALQYATITRAELNYSVNMSFASSPDDTDSPIDMLFPLAPSNLIFWWSRKQYVLRVTHIPGTDQTTDILTNPFSFAWFLKLHNKLNVVALKANKTELKMAWDSYLSASESWQNTDAKLQTKRENKDGIMKRFEEKNGELESFELEISNIDVSHLDERERKLQFQLERMTKQRDEKEFELKKSQIEKEVLNVEQKIKVVNREFAAMATDSKERGRLSLMKLDLETKKKQHKKIIDGQKDKIRRVLQGRIPPDKDIKKEITQALRTVAADFDELNVKYREVDKEVNVLQMKIQEVDNNLSKHHKDMESRKRFIESKLQSLDQQCSGIDSYLKHLESVKEKRDVQKSKYNIADGMRQMFDPFERVARAHHICPCCERSFSPEEEDSFVMKQRVKAASSAEHMKVLAVESSSADSDYQQLDKLRMWYEEYVKLSKETIPKAEKELQQVKEELDHKSQALDDALGILAQVKTDKDLVEMVLQPVENADRIFLEIQSLQKKVEDLESELGCGGPGVRTLEEIQSELAAVQGTKDNLKTELEKLADEQMDMQKDISSIQTRLLKARDDKMNAEKKLQGGKRLEEELECLKEEMVQIDLDVKSLVESVEPLSMHKDKILADYNELKIRLDLEIENLVEKKRIFQQEAEAVFRMTSKIIEYSNLKKGDKLKELQEKKSLSESQLQSCETRMQEIIDELDKRKDLMRNTDLLKIKIEDNLKYRETKAKVDKLSYEVDTLEENMLKVGAVSTIQTELAKLSKERERLLEELNRCKGTVSVYQSNISKNKIDLKQAHYKDIDRRYFDQLIQLKTTEMANKDLDRYYNALDKALMRFHTMKMEEINKIIRELWQQTYRGQDIDCISIHSDSEGGGTRSYSYRVLMQTGDAELEMRGRCSAGQKVLASLIIRLALAETFCLNCGILALDEPTTNLDGPNSESLAAAILRIMEDRKGQENFQLIVITHDERFAQLIGQRQHAERYYRVAKDDYQHSIIESQAIFD
ncbi:DNA repair protein rad50 [Lathyrus oleraceus]|uniref:DNA repair protein RAD50 n=1 Tax=Pisum sativum TaxID=3888 RepID=A0A9D4WP22_PEA|nr:DNA repair protein rad50 [Pisum sativum]